MQGSAKGVDKSAEGASRSSGGARRSVEGIHEVQEGYEQCIVVEKEMHCKKRLHERVQKMEDGLEEVQEGV